MTPGSRVPVVFVPSRRVHGRAGSLPACAEAPGWKDRQIQEWDQGWSFVDDDHTVCAKCFEDYAIKDFIRDNATETSCSYCGRSAEEDIAAPMNEVLRLIGESLDYEYDDPNDAGVPVEGGEYVFDTMSTREVLAGLDTITENEDVMEEILNAFSDSAWVDKPFYSLAEDDQLRYGWRDFVKAVKYERRYLFLKPKRKKGVALTDGVPPDEMLDRIGKVINEVGLVREMKAGTPWFRARQHDPAKTYTSAADLGTAPRKYAQTSNRMSPAGIPMFYGANDEATAIAETYTPTPGVATTVTVATFETARDMRVVDLSDLPPVPSLFDEERRHLRSGISFLRDFVEDVAKPIQKDGREHIKYVPTQIVTEYLRHIFRADGGYRVRGVIYRSSRNGNGKCSVLFVGNKGCCETTAGWQADKKKRLGLVGTPLRHDYP